MFLAAHPVFLAVHSPLLAVHLRLLAVHPMFLAARPMFLTVLTLFLAVHPLFLAEHLHFFAERLRTNYNFIRAVHQMFLAVHLMFLTTASCTHQFSQSTAMNAHAAAVPLLRHENARLQLSIVAGGNLGDCNKCTGQTYTQCELQHIHWSHYLRNYQHTASYIWQSSEVSESSSILHLI